ncbi:MAG: M23 family metallopeptidase [Anaerolineae bacterium]|nr:M23 family metallopeptidase [Anaerolineae bacterium]
MRRGVLTTILVILAFGGFGLLLWANARPGTSSGVIVIPTLQAPTDDPESWQAILQAGFGSNATPLPTIGISTQAFVPPTLALVAADSTLAPLAPVQVGGGQPTLNAVVTATRPAPTAALLATDSLVTAQVVTRPPADWNPPPLIPPISRDPLGRDHYWFSRPVDSNATNFALFSYAFGSDGPQQENPWRVHHGIDMPNPIGQTVRAAGSGTVVWAGPGFQDSPSYGNVVFIRHDFGYNGQPLFTLYAHLANVFVSAGQIVNAEDPIGLVGNTGRVSGPHVHFEVRVGGDRYGDTYNPLLWMVSYVGHGAIAGRVMGPRGDLLQDQTVTIRDFRTGLVVQSTTTYIFLDNGSDVNSDPLWQETFVVGDIPVGRYEVITNIDGLRVSELVDVSEGMTSFVELALTQQEIPELTPTAGS